MHGACPQEIKQMQQEKGNCTGKGVRERGGGGCPELNSLKPDATRERELVQ